MVTSYWSLKVFSLESFPLYGTVYWSYLTLLISWSEIQPPFASHFNYFYTYVALVQEDFDRLDYSMARALSSQLLQQVPQAPQPPQNAGTTPTIISAVVSVVIVLFMMILISVVGFILYKRFK